MSAAVCHVLGLSEFPTCSFSDFTLTSCCSTAGTGRQTGGSHPTAVFHDLEEQALKALHGKRCHQFEGSVTALYRDERSSAQLWGSRACYFRQPRCRSLTCAHVASWSDIKSAHVRKT